MRANTTNSSNFWKFSGIVILIALCMFVHCTNMNAQAYVKKDASTYVQTSKSNQQPIMTNKYWVDSNGNKYVIFLTAKSAYIVKTSKKTGKEYKQYLPKEISNEIRKEYENNSKESKRK